MNAITIRPFSNVKVIRETLTVLGILLFLTLLPYRNEIVQMETIHQQNGSQYDWWTHVSTEYGYGFSALIPSRGFALEIFIFELLFLSSVYLYSKKFSIFEQASKLWKELLVILSTVSLASILVPTWTFSSLSKGMQFSGYDFFWNVHIHHLDFYIFYSQLIISLGALYFVRKRYSEQIQSWLLK